MLRYKLFMNMALVVVLFALLAAATGIRMITQNLVKEGQKRARLDLGSAWAVYENRLDQLETVVRLAALKDAVVAMCRSGEWDNEDLNARLERIRIGFELDFLGVAIPSGQVMLRTGSPGQIGDYISMAPVMQAARGAVASSMELMTGPQLGGEAEGLAEKAFIAIEDTPKARLTSKSTESRGMVMISAAPVLDGQQVLAVVYGGVLVNRNHVLVDHIRDVIYKDESYKGSPVGTATIFLNDVRVATTVRNRNGNRAIGTRASREVADAVLDNARPWTSKAFVVNDWYLTAYEPIQDGSDSIIGMLYVGILKKPFDDCARTMIARYLAVALFVLLVALVAAYLTARRLAQPIQSLVEASISLRRGHRPENLPPDRSCMETGKLVDAFNGMAEELYEREQKLTTVNRNYMEALGFVSHELKSPVGVIINYCFSMLAGTLGPLTEKQAKALKGIDASGKRLATMIRQYLNLSRIENGELAPEPAVLAVRTEILDPLFDSYEAELAVRHMPLTCRVDRGIKVLADPDMVREIFENLLSNAVKYGTDRGAITVDAALVGNFVEFKVRNEGAGISCDKRHALFAKFTRLKTDVSDTTRRGTGLGLFITKQIVELHGGRITADSETGKWTEFIFTLPVPGEAAGPGTSEHDSNRETEMRQ